MVDIADLQKEWLAREEEKLVTKRRYPHFDPIVLLDDKRKKIIFSSKEVGSYSFFPFIHTIHKERRRIWNVEHEARRVVSKERPICYAAHLDSLIFSWYGFLLNAWYEDILKEEGITDVVIAYRKLNKSTPDFVRDVGDAIKMKQGCVALCFDITGFFDNISHSELYDNWLRVAAPKVACEGGRLPEDHYKIYRAVTKFHFVEKKAVEDCFPKGKISVKNGRYAPKISFIQLVMTKHRDLKTNNHDGLLVRNPGGDHGIPQGLPLSGTLANISMLNFDKQMTALAANYNGAYRRYSDDILLIVEVDASNTVKVAVEKALAEIGLKSNEGKAERFIFSRNPSGVLSCVNQKDRPSRLQYLGIEFDGQYYYIRSQSVSKFYRNLKRSVGRAAWKLKKHGGSILRHRDLFKRFIGSNSLSDTQNFLSYTKLVHRSLKPFSRVNRQISEKKITRIIKDEVKKRTSNSSIAK